MNKILQNFAADSKVLLSTPAAEKSLKLLAFIFAIFSTLGVSIGIPFSGDNAYYIILTLSLLFLIYKGGIKISTPFVALYSIILINILVVDIPDFFKPFQRAILFIMMTMTCSAAMDTDVSIRFRSYLFRYIIYCILIISVLSFFCFFMGINLMKSPFLANGTIENYQSRGGWFSGLTTHSMILGPISMISALTFYFLYQKRSDILYLTLFFVTTMSAVFSSSRASLLGLGIAIIVNLIFGKVVPKIRKRMVRILALSAILVIPISGVAFKGLMDKQTAREKQASGLNSRQGKFEYRLNEFKSSPILGVGFSAIDTTSGDQYDSRTGQIEPGTSHLAALSMTGILGFAAYLFILYAAFRNIKRGVTLHSRFLFSCFIALFVHAWFEGYIFAGGNYLALVYWLVIGLCIDDPKVVQMFRRRNKHSVTSKSIGHLR